MLKHIAEEILRDFPGIPHHPQALRDELGAARSHVLALIGRHLTAFSERFPAETCVKGYYPLTRQHRMDHQLLDRAAVAGVGDER